MILPIVELAIWKIERFAGKSKNSIKPTVNLLAWNYLVVSFTIDFLIFYLNFDLLFLGAGGLGVGMDLSEFVETRYAVEFSPAAAKTYQ